MSASATTSTTVKHSAFVPVLAIMSFSALACVVLRRKALQGIESRSVASCGGSGVSCNTPCACEQPKTIDPIVEEENSIEKNLPPELKALHAQAVAKGESTYIDPKTGFSVFTRLGQMKNLKCCGCRCRHCPYGHVNVRTKRATSTASPASAANSNVAAAEAAAGKDAPAAAPKHSVVYTKTGDRGTSALFTGERRKKTDPVFEALGAIDELSSHVGLARAMLRGAPDKREHDAEMMAMLEDIQQELLNAGTVVATPTGMNAEDETARRMTDILEGYRFPEKTAEMEKAVDVMDSRLVPLRIFILPGGGNVTSAQLHVCRTVCRRAERCMIEVRDVYGEGYSDHLRQATVYVNRLSDFLFVAARSVAEEDIVRKYD